MLHAFLQKGVRRVLVIGKPEPSRDGNEDAITSMVFGPLCFMAPGDAMRCLAVAFGTRFTDFVGQRQIASHEVLFWPGRLRATVDDDGTEARCEPDLVVLLTFVDGSRIAVVCEMKWDAPDGAVALGEQLNREREAVEKGLRVPEADQFAVAIGKNRLAFLPAGVNHAVTWSTMEGALAVEGRTGRPGSPSQVWARLVAEFLRKAEQSTFQGFGEVPDMTDLASKPFVFFGGAA